MWGTIALPVGTLGSSVLKLLGKEDKARLFDLISSTSVNSQQIIYFPKLVLPLFNSAREIEMKLSDERFTKRFTSDELKELKGLTKNTKRLGYLGVGCLLLSSLNTTLKLKNFENSILNKAVEIIDGLSNDLICKFFSYRRYILGLGFRLLNPEFYPDYKEEEQVDQNTLESSTNGQLKQEQIGLKEQNF